MKRILKHHYIKIKTANKTVYRKLNMLDISMNNYLKIYIYLSSNNISIIMNFQ